MDTKIKSMTVYPDASGAPAVVISGEALDTLIAECAKKDSVKVVFLKHTDTRGKWFVVNRFGFTAFSTKADAIPYARKLRTKLPF